MQRWELLQAVCLVFIVGIKASQKKTRNSSFLAPRVTSRSSSELRAVLRSHQEHNGSMANHHSWWEGGVVHCSWDLARISILVGASISQASYAESRCIWYALCLLYALSAKTLILSGQVKMIKSFVG
ncbi:hypothetical protein B0H19DRAFT_1239181 [Mycena capillaripes]|nr:hypothetical protein B0H19DRAFT_1239181 [Mycena capillaripes]